MHDVAGDPPQIGADRAAAGVVTAGLAHHDHEGLLHHIVGDRGAAGHGQREAEQPGRQR